MLADCGASQANDGVMDWDELLKHMDDMSMKWRDAIKGSAARGAQRGFAEGAARWHTTAGRFFF